jgi:aminoglycoside phosphotransferase (APT) family kinase protein
MEARSLTGTEPLTSQQGIDLARLEAYLRYRLPDCPGAMEISRFRGGQSNPTLQIGFDGKPRYVLRKKPNGKLLPSAHAVDREYRVLTALRETGIPIASPRLLCDDESVVGTMFYVMDYVEGRVFWDPSLPELTIADRRAVFGEMNRAIADLHQLDPQALGLQTYGKPGDYVARQIDRWTRQYRASETERIDSMEQLITWLPGNMPRSDEARLVHGDFRLDNMIFHPTEPRLLAIVDWELSTLGHPLADFAYHMMTWHLPNVPFRGLEDRDLAALGIPNEPTYRDAYLASTGRPPIRDATWRAYLAFSMFRVACIRQGIMRRVVDGTATSRFAHEAGLLARDMADRAWHQAEQAR